MFPFVSSSGSGHFKMNVRQRHQMVLKLVTCLIKVVHAVDAHELFRLRENIVVDDLGKVLFKVVIRTGP